MEEGNSPEQQRGVSGDERSFAQYTLSVWMLKYTAQKSSNSNFNHTWIIREEKETTVAHCSDVAVEIFQM